ncbi:MAG: PAS domain S-box protein [Syntrophaceae bacterium]|nr:PAS domain S-box protein [Syntrophaceae bacterium]
MKNRVSDGVFFRNRWMALHYFLFFIILLPYGPDSGLADSQTRSQNQLENKNVLILNAFESNVPAFKKTNHGLSATLQSGGIEIRNQFYENLDLRRNPGPENRRLLVELIHQRYGQRKIDFIVTRYPDSLKFLIDEGQAIFPDVPVLALLLPQGFELPETARRIIPHLVIPDLKGTIEIALKLVPKAQRVYVVGGVHPVDKWLENMARQDFRTLEGRLEFRYLSTLPLEEIVATVSRAPSDSIVFTTAFAKDVTGKHQTMVEVSQQLARVSNAPVFGLLDTLLGHGIVGGSLISFEYIGTKAGEIALDILREIRNPESIPTVMEVPRLDMFDWRQLKRWKLSESALPKGSIVINREFSLWDFKYYIFGALAFIIAQSFLIAGLLMQRRRRRSVEGLLLQKSEELDQFFNFSLDLLCIANTDGYFLHLNPAWEKSLGHGREELMARRFFDFVHTDDLAKTHEALSDLASQQRVIYFRNRYQCKDGTYRWLDWTSAPAGNLIFAVARDVTDLKLAEEALHERLRFEHLISDLSAGFVNLPTDAVDSEINRGLRSITEFLNVDRCSIGLFSEDKNQLVLVFEYVSPRAEPAPKSISKEQMPWYLEQLIQGNPVVFNQVEDLPPEAEKERRACLHKNMKSVLSVPIVSGGKTLGSCALVATRSERVWPKELVKRFRLITDVFSNALERRQAEESSRENERILRQNENDLRRLAGRLISAQEEERSRLARELHDDLAQRLAVFAIDVGQIEQRLGDLPEPVRETLNEMKKGIVTISQDVHNLSRQIHPSILDDLGLIKAVESECAHFSKREGIEIVFNHENIPTVIPKGISLSLYRITQEGLSNISKHACANRISVSLKGTGHDVLLSVQDDGIGFDPAEVREKPGLGFSSMRERTRLMHGEFSVSSQPERGTVIKVKVPLTRKEG